MKARPALPVREAATAAGLLRSPIMMGGLVLAALCYNAVLAFLNARGLFVSLPHVAGTEALIMGLAFCIAGANRERGMRTWMLLLFGFGIVFSFVLLVNGFLGQSVSLKAFRDVMVVASFGLLGVAFHARGGHLGPVLSVSAIIVLAGLALERFALATYAGLFSPMQYLVNTRGVADRQAEGFDGLDLFFNTQRLEGRFSFGLIGDHRLSSIFLEQTTLGNFAILLCLALSAFWAELTKRQRAVIGTAAALCMVLTDSRMALGMGIICLAGYFFLGRVAASLRYLVMPTFLLLSWILLYDGRLNSLSSDDLPGRFAWSLTQLSWIDLQGAFGGRPELIDRSWDSGYAYFIYSQTIVGLAILWLFTARVLPTGTFASRTLGYLLPIFLTVNLMVGPTLLSIKTGALLWFMVGYAQRQALTTGQLHEK